MLYVKLRSSGWCDICVSPPETDEATIVSEVEKKHGDDIIIIVGTTLDDPSPDELEALAFATRLGYFGRLTPGDLQDLQDCLAGE